MVYLTVAMMALPTGIVIYIWGSTNNSTKNMVAGGLIVVLAVVMWFLSVRTALKEQKDDAERQNRLISILEAIATKMGVDVDKINGKDRDIIKKQ